MKKYSSWFNSRSIYMRIHLHLKYSYFRRRPQSKMAESLSFQQKSPGWEPVKTLINTCKLFPLNKINVLIELQVYLKKILVLKYKTYWKSIYAKLTSIIYSWQYGSKQIRQSTLYGYRMFNHYGEDCRNIYIIYIWKPARLTANSCRDQDLRYICYCPPVNVTPIKENA